MEFGRISRSGKPIELEEWLALIDSHSALEHAPDRVGVNPFTQEPIVFSGKGVAFFCDDGEPVGNIAFEDGELGTTGVPRNVCEEIAVTLRASLYEDDRS